MANSKCLKLINDACLYEGASISPEAIRITQNAYERFEDAIRERFFKRLMEDPKKRIDKIEGTILATGVLTLGLNTYLFTYDQLEELLLTFLHETLESLKTNIKYSAEAEKLLQINYELDLE